MWVLSEVVCDPLPKTEIGKERAQELMKLGIKVSKKMPPVVNVVFVGGALTELSRYLLTHKIDTLIWYSPFLIFLILLLISRGE